MPITPRELDRAIEDLDEAIRLDSANAYGFRYRAAVYDAKDEYVRAIADYDQAIKLDAKNAYSFRSRGYAYYAKGELDRAIEDLDEAIRLDPANAYGFRYRGAVYDRKGEHARAIADYDQAIELDPNGSRGYLGRGLANFYFNAPTKALTDLGRSSELDPSYAYAALWLDIVGRRSNLASRLAEATMQIDMSKWPAPVIRLYLGQMTSEAVLAAAENPNPRTKRGQICEANFYTGELALQHGAKDHAIRLFRLAARGCPNTFDERSAANAELKALGAEP